jgi:hypothetical protein
MAVVEEDAEHPVPERLHNLAFHLDLFFLGRNLALLCYWAGATFVASGPF